jgi:FAD/FMN-containing dehydrogenase
MLMIPEVLEETTVTTHPLQARISGQVITPDDVDYDAARKAWNLTVDQYPSLIVVVRRAFDVAKAVRYARENGLGVAVQSTGHGITLPANDAMLIVTSEMNDVYVDAASQTAWVQAGAQWGAVLDKAQEFGLAPLLGSSPYVGVVGYTLGGGMGWLARKYGMALDSVRAFEVVIPEGRLVRASETENSDLFWALRGGGGSFGIVTSMEIQLYPVKVVYGGNLLYPVEAAKEVFIRFREWTANAPEELTSAIVIMNFPPIPQVPDFLRGKSVIMIRGLYCGDPAQGEAMLKEHWLDWMPPMANMWRVMPFSEIETVSNDPKDPAPGYATGGWMNDLNDDTIDTLIRLGVASPVVFVEIRHAGGAIAKADRNANAFSHRSSPLNLHMVGMTPTREAREAVKAYTQMFKQELKSALTGKVYMNFEEAEVAREKTKDGYSAEAYKRLTEVKAKYDANDLLRYSYDIPPVKA